MGIIFFLVIAFAPALCGCHAAPFDDEERAYVRPPHDILAYKLGGHTQDLWRLKALQHTLYASPRALVHPANFDEQHGHFFGTMGSASVLDVMNKIAPLPPMRGLMSPASFGRQTWFYTVLFSGTTLLRYAKEFKNLQNKS
ncbi:MAG: hypothetical protein C0514_00715 [Candidatus Puniceispirillum sp.]|nr:hypothetical protein [Candidatus Puniceispirillum sp.]